MTPEEVLTFTPRRTLIDEVPVYSCDVPTLPPTIGIVFRVGAVDESLGYRGVTHLVEHLALRDLRTAQYSFNAGVSPLRTTFTASGTTDDLAAFARGLCENLRNLPLGELRRERQVLGTESVGRRPTLAGHLMAIHCGHTPYGLMNMPEFGLARVSSDDVAAWAASRFTRDNVAVWVAGPVPDHLAFDLPRGTRVQTPEPAVVPAVTHPVHVPADIGGVALSAVTDWSLALEVAAVVCQARLTERLRFKEGISYHTVGTLNRYTSRTGHLMIVSDCVNGAAEQASQLLMEIVDGVAAHGHFEAETHRLLENTRRGCATLERLLAILDEWAFSEVTSVEPRTLAETMRAIAAIEACEVAQTMTRALERAVLVLPSDCAPPGQRFRPRVRETQRGVGGQTFWKERGALFSFGNRGGPSITIGADGVSHVNATGECTTVYFERCAGLLKYSEDRRVLLGEDGESIEFVATEWPDGREIAFRVDAAVPDDRIIWISW
jgi:zinc protease